MKKQQEVLMYVRNKSNLKDIILKQEEESFVIEMRRKRNISSDNIPFLHLRTTDKDLAFDSFEKLQDKWNIGSLNLNNYDSYLIIK